MTRYARTAFTLVEVLVVIAIIGIMVALLLPGVQAAREMARRAQCSYRLSQLIIATHNYESAHRVFPPGVVNDTGPIVSKETGYHYSWIVQLLPYLGEQNAFRSIDFSVGVYAPQNAGVRAHWMEVVQCPSSFISSGVSTSSYAAVYDSAEVPIDADNNGVFFRNSFLCYDDITDGLAYTLFFGDRRIDPKGKDLGWMSGTRATLRNTGIPLNTTDARPVGPPPPPSQSPYDVGSPPDGPKPAKPPTPKKRPAVGGFGAEHPVVVPFALGDGSVRSIVESIDQRTFQLMGDRADGEMIDLDF